VTIFDPRRNSIGFLRVLFATLVIVSHAWPLGGFGKDPGRASNNLGFLAVEGFFALSGFLITRSGSSLGTGRFLWHRMLRIFPAYWVCLVVIAAGFAPIVWHASHSLSQYFLASPSPLGFFVNNVVLTNAQQSIGDTLLTNPYPTLWDGPLYTLYYEFVCYLVIAALGALRILNRRVVLALGIGVWVWQQLILFGLVGAFDPRQATLTVCFLAGSLVWLWRDKLLSPRLSWWLAGAAAVIAATTYLTAGFRQIGVLAFAYLVIWAGAKLPFHRFGVKRDFSYGMYIYGWPMLQLASFFGLNALGLPVYLAIVVVATLGLAAASWYLVESRALRLKNASAPGWLSGLHPLRPDSSPEPAIPAAAADPA
jgi:peptidoglycan/LPS O-acetylase OafA/YrhL